MSRTIGKVFPAEEKPVKKPKGKAETAETEKPEATAAPEKDDAE